MSVKCTTDILISTIYLSTWLSISTRVKNCSVQWLANHSGQQGETWDELLYQDSYNYKLHKEISFPSLLLF